MNHFIEKYQILLEGVLSLIEKEERKEHYFPIHIESKQRNVGIVKDVVKSLNIRKMKNLKAAKELLEKYKSITLEELEQKYKIDSNWKGQRVMKSITGFGTTHCPICAEVSKGCEECIYSFRIVNSWDIPCMDIIYKEIEEATSAEELFNAIQKRISYLTHVIEWYETMDKEYSSKYY